MRGNTQGITPVVWVKIIPCLRGVVSKITSNVENICIQYDVMYERASFKNEVFPKQTLN